ncbi:MAG TPA: histone deacetylase family protein [bacterium]|nr:histone deacetylase family protein [bacterium]
MFRIRRLADPDFPAEKKVIQQVQEIIRRQFPLLNSDKVDRLPDQLNDPLKYGFRASLFIAEDRRAQVKGFALLFYAPDLRFHYLDLIAADSFKTTGGVGGALYQRVREEVGRVEGLGLFFECLPDDESVCLDRTSIPQNIARLKFYERFGARPIIGTAYEAPVTEKDKCPPFLVYDPVKEGRVLLRRDAKRVVQAILERCYGDLCSPEYISLIVTSFGDDPVRIRKPRYSKGKKIPAPSLGTASPPFHLVMSARHAIHHIRERGYVESPARLESILKDVKETSLFNFLSEEEFSEAHIRRTHDDKMVDFIKNAASWMEKGETLYPYIFPVRNPLKIPNDPHVQAGYYCIDTFTPITSDIWAAARSAANCSLTAARLVLDEGGVTYALVRPPGHHAERKVFGGFCYLNNVAVVSDFLSPHGRVAILDVDFHHGNGQQEIFYERSDVLTVSLHGHPSFAYPYFSGFANEKGRGQGEGYNLNYPLAETTSFAEYRTTLSKAIQHIKKFNPAFLVVALGLDTAKGDPTGTWRFRDGDFFLMGEDIGNMNLPTVVVQEGGYRTLNIGLNVRRFFEGMASSRAPE